VAVTAAQTLANHRQTGAAAGHVKKTCVKVASCCWQVPRGYKWEAALPLWMWRWKAPTKSLP
jgi:hypothetical protein